MRKDFAQGGFGAGLVRGRVCKFFGGVEAGAGFGGKFIVGMDGDAGIAGAQTVYQGAEGGALSGGTGVGGSLAVSSESADVGHSYAVGVVAEAVCANLLFGTSGKHFAGKGHDIMIAYAVETAGAVP